MRFADPEVIATERTSVRVKVRTFWSAHVAQLVEHVLGKDEVTGSIPVVSSRDFTPIRSRSVLSAISTSGGNSIGRVTAFQAVGCGFESRLPLSTFTLTDASMLRYLVGIRGVRSNSLVFCLPPLSDPPDLLRDSGTGIQFLRSVRIPFCDVADTSARYPILTVSKKVSTSESTYGCSSTGRATVSKTVGCGFKSCHPCNTVPI